MTNKSRVSYWADKNFLKSAASALILLGASLVVNYMAGSYAAESASNTVTDLILDNMPRMNVSFIFVSGTILFWIFVAGLLLYVPRRLPFTIKAVALFTLIRSGFITLTHLGPAFEAPATAISFGDRIINNFTFGADLFFSAHTGLPFLLALIFWREKLLRIFFIAVSVVSGAAVLLGHLHYSIDVFAAFFITYAIWHIAEFLFKKDLEIK